MGIVLFRANAQYKIGGEIMEIFGKDLIIGEFRLSDYGMILSSFDDQKEKEDEIGFTISTVEEFVGDNPIPKYIGDKYTNKIKPRVTFMKNPCMYNGNNIHFTEKECRNILRAMTGIRGYQWMKVINDNNEDDIWFRSKIVNISSKKIGGLIMGLIIDMECDSSFGWSSETLIDLKFLGEKSVRIYSNTDDLHNYIYPLTTIKFGNDGIFTLTNKTENRVSEIKNVTAGEIISIDSKNEIITSSIDHPLLLNDFNLNWIRLMPDSNELLTNMDAQITFNYRVPRKVVT